MEKNIIFIILLLIFIINKIKNKEKFTLTSDDETRIRSIIKDIYSTDLDAIRTLAAMAKKIQENGLTVNGDLNVTGKATSNSLISDNLRINGNGIITGTFYAPGSVVQIQSNITSLAVRSENWGGYHDIHQNFYVDITPKFSTSKFLIQGVLHLGGNTDTDSRFTFIRLGRVINGTLEEIGNGDVSQTSNNGSACIAAHNWGAGSTDYNIGIANISIVYLDTPNTALKIRYKFRWCSNPGNGGQDRRAYLNKVHIHNDNFRPNTISTITVTEIAQ